MSSGDAPLSILRALPTTEHQPDRTQVDEMNSATPDGADGDRSGGGEKAVATGGRPAGTRPPRIVWWITALNFCLLGAYSILLPTYRAPDEPLHVDLAHLFANELVYPPWDSRDTGSDVQRSLGYVEFGQRAEHLTAERALPKSERPSFEDLDVGTIATGINQLPQHPPLYYVAAGGAERAVEVVIGDPDFQLETWFYRMVSVLLVTPLPWIIWRVAALLGLPTVVAIAATVVPLTIPQYLHIGSSVNNDSLQLLLFWLITPLVIRVAGGDLSTRTAVAGGFITGLGLLTKAFAFVMVAWMLAALLVVLRRAGRSALRDVGRATVVFSGVSFLLGGWWWARNLILYGELMPSRFGRILPTVDEPRDFGEFLHAWGSATTRRFWGDFGWYDVHMSGVVVTIATVICLGAVIVCCVRRDRVAGVPVGDRLLLAAPFLLLVAGQFGVALQAYLDTGRLGGLQGRYWFGALAALGVLIALGAANLVPKHTRHLPLAVLSAVVVMQGFAVSSIAGYYWGEPRSALADRLRALVAWAPMPGEVIALAAVVAIVVVVGTVTQMVSLARTRVAQEA